MVLKDTYICSMCKKEESIEHVMLNCEDTESFWKEVHKWIISLGCKGFKLPESKIIILGDIKDNYVINYISVGKKVILNDQNGRKNKTCICQFVKTKIVLTRKGMYKANIQKKDKTI